MSVMSVLFFFVTHIRYCVRFKLPLLDISTIQYLGEFGLSYFGFLTIDVGN